MNNEDIPSLGVAELSALIKDRSVSPVEATQAYLDRIDSLDFKFNSYLTVARRQAMETAEEAERVIAQGNYLGPMHGVPVAVKDQFLSKGIRSTGGSKFLVDFVPDEDATVIANLKKAGAIVLGKTNLTEFAIGGGFQRYSTPRNPWTLDLYTGSSSSGSGAATAARLCATSLGEDTGGSIRFPAAWCGLVGMKPSWGRVSRYGVMRGVWSMDTVGPISRSVEDAAITLGAIAGHDPQDPYTWDTPVPDYREALTGDIRGLRVGLVTEQTHTDVVDPEVREAVIGATAVLGELGATVEEVAVPLSRHSMLITIALLAVEPSSNHGDWVKDRIQDYLWGNRIQMLSGSILPAQAYYKAQKLRAMLRQEVLQALDSYDVLVMPTVGKTAQNIESFSQGTLMRRPYLLTATFNLANAPAITVPCGFSGDGLPIGLQIGSKPGADETVLRVAHAYEQNTEWHNRKPPTI